MNCPYCYFFMVAYEVTDTTIEWECEHCGERSIAPRYQMFSVPGQVVGFEYIVFDMWFDVSVYSSDDETASLAECDRLNAAQDTEAR